MAEAATQPAKRSNKKLSAAQLEQRDDARAMAILTRRRKQLRALEQQMQLVRARIEDGREDMLRRYCEQQRKRPLFGRDSTAS